MANASISSKILIDTGEPNVRAYLENLVEKLDADGSNIGAIIATHWHYDHTGGIAQIREHFCQVWLKDLDLIIL